jgi:hypothetical protein
VLSYGCHNALEEALWQPDKVYTFMSKYDFVGMVNYKVKDYFWEIVEKVLGSFTKKISHQDDTSLANFLL